MTIDPVSLASLHHLMKKNVQCSNSTCTGSKMKSFNVKMDKTYDDLFASIGQATCMCAILVFLGNLYQIIFIMVVILIFFKIYEVIHKPHKNVIPRDERRYLASIEEPKGEALRKRSIYYHSHSASSR